MKAKFLALAALVLGLVSCQTEPEGLDVNVGGVVDTVVTVNIPEAETRSAANSAVGAFTDGTCTEGVVRYIMQVYYNGETSADEYHRQVTYSTGTTVSFPVRLVAGRHYNFVVWADVVAAEGDGDKHYNTTDLKNITLKGEWNAMDETRDAFTGYYDTAVHGDKTPYNGAKSINIDLYRPFAKLRVVTTDYNVLNSYGVTPTYATVSYTTDHRVAFNAFSGQAMAATESGKTHEYEIKTYSGETDAARTIFADYFFAENDVVKFSFNVYEDAAKTKLIKQINFNTDINVRRNYLTTLMGDVLTEGGNIGVTVRPGFGDENADDYNYEVLTSGDQLVNAINAGGSYKVGNDIYVADTRAAIATRAAAGQTTTILNLNGYKITFEEGATIEVSAGTTLIINDESENNTGAIEAGNDAGFVVNNGGALTIESGNIGAGAIENNGTTNLEGGNFAAGAVVNGADGEANISNGDIQPEAVTGNTEDVKNYAAELVVAFTNGGDYTLQADITLANNNSNNAIGYQLPAGKTLNLDLNGFAINASSNEITNSIGALVDVRGTLNVKNGTITTKHVGTDYAWNKGAEIFYVGFGGTLNVENATLENLGGTAMAYCIDLVNADSNGITVNVKNSTLKSPYIPFRVFNNGSGMNNVDIQNTTLDGKYCFWVHIFTDTDTNGKGCKTSTLNIKNLFGGTNTFKFNNTRNAAAIYGFDDELYLDAQGNYLVGDVVSLKSLAKFVNGGNTLQGKSVKLTADIDLAGEEWTPIGNSTNTFNGTFDGQGHKISNLVVTGNNSYVGLFGFTTNGEIKNLVVENAKVSGRLGVGVIAGSPYTSKITNVAVTGHVEVNGMAYVGGVGGRNAYATWDGVTVNVDASSYVNANSVEDGVAYRTYVGGVCGFNGEGGHSFKNIKSNINVTGSTIDVGGLFGIAHYSNKFENCSCSGNVEVTGAESAEDAQEMGGIAGVWHNADGTEVHFDNCTFTGKLKANIEGVEFYYNGLIGKPYGEGTGKLYIDGVEVFAGVVVEDLAGLQAALNGTLPIVLNKTIVVEEGDVTLDLNGKNVTAPTSSAFEVKGGKLTIKNGNVTAYEAVVRALVGGEVVIESGKYVQTGTAVDTPSTYRYCVDVREGGKATINGGEFTSGNGMLNINSEGELIVNGGKFTNSVEKTMTRHFAYVGGKLTIKDGEFYGKANSSAGGCFFCGAATGCDIQVTGGKFTSLWVSGSVNRIFESYYGGTINVTGGLFNTNGGIADFVVANDDEATKSAYPYKAK